MKRTSTIFLAASTLLAAPAFATTPTVTGGAGSDQVQIQFIYSKAFFDDQLVVNNAAATGLGNCRFGTYNGAAVPNCVWDEGACASDIDTTATDTTCMQPFPGDVTCDCLSNQPFITIGTVGGLGGSSIATGVFGVALDLQLYINTTRTINGSDQVADTIILDSAPNAPACATPPVLGTSCSVFAATDPNHAFNHLRVTPLQVPAGVSDPLNATGSVLLLEWEDGPGGGDQDYNDLVAIVRTVPATCSATQNGIVDPFCSKSAVTGTDTHFLTHVQATNPSAATSGFRMQTTLINYGAATNIGLCQELRTQLPNTATALENFQRYHYATGQTPDCQGGAGQNVPVLALSHNGKNAAGATGNTDYVTAPSTPLCGASIPALDTTCTQTVGGTTSAISCDDVLPLTAGTSTSPSVQTFNSPADRTGVATFYLYDDSDAHMSQDGDMFRNSTTFGQRSQTDVFKSTFIVTSGLLGTGSQAACSTTTPCTSPNEYCEPTSNKCTTLPPAPITSYLYTGVSAGFRCPSGPGAQLTSVSGDSLVPTQKLQGVPDVIAVNSPVDIVIQTVPIGFEDPTGPSVGAYMIYTWTDNLPELIGAPSLSGIISTTNVDGSALNFFGNATELFFVGGNGVRAVKTHIAIPNNVPEGFEGTLVATLIEKATGKSLIVSTYPLAKDHTAPTVSAASTVRTQTGVRATVTASDLGAGLETVYVVPTINSATSPQTDLMQSSGDFFSATTFSGDVSATPADVVALSLTVADSHLNGLGAPLSLPVADNGGDRTVECNSFTGANVALDGSRSTGNGLSYLWSGPFGGASGVSVVEPLPFGSSAVTLAVADGHGFTGTETANISVGDTTPPTLTVSASPSCVWPPNHKGVSFGLGSEIKFTVSDTCDPNPTVRVLSVTSSDGSAVSFDGTHFCALANKDVTYTVTVQATDAHGNSSTATTTITVPHNFAPGCADPNGMSSC